MTHLEIFTFVNDSTLQSRAAAAIVVLASAVRANPSAPDLLKQFANHTWTPADASKYVPKILTGLAILDADIRDAYTGEGGEAAVTDTMLSDGIEDLVTTYGGAHL